LEFRAVLVDDEPPARKKLRHLLSAHPDFRVVGEAGTFGEAQAVLAAERPDVVFLDIQLGPRNGMELAAGLEEAAVVFVTAYDQYAAQAFRVQAFDYLLKPVAPDVFDELVGRLRARAGAYVKRFLVEGRPGTVEFVAVEEVDWFESARNYVVLHCGAETHIIRSSLEAVQRRLDPGAFARANRSAIVNVAAIACLRPWTNGEFKIQLKTGEEIPWSRRYVSAALAALLGEAR
jgi:two-component system, LytTR family, response regulator